MAECCAVEVAQLRDRERGRGKREADVGVGELAAKALAGGQHHRPVVEGERELAECVDRVPARVGWECRLGVAWDEAEVRGRELAPERVPAGIAQRLELLEVRELPDVDLGFEVAADRTLERLVAR